MYIYWLEGMSEEEVEALTIQSYNQYEKNRMTTNACKVMGDVANRLHGAPVLSEHLYGLESTMVEEHFFFNREWLRKFLGCSSASKQKDDPGSAYDEKIPKFQTVHFQRGELYLE